jgi:transcriptional regulator with XRE-family HTH domain
MAKKRKKTVSQVGLNIKRLRARAGLSQIALAEEAGLSRDCIAKLECGDRAGATSSTVSKLARALGVSEGRLLERRVQKARAALRA